MESVNSFDFQHFWNVFSSIIFPLATFGICLYYVIMKQNLDGFLMAGGSFIHILSSIFYTVVLPIMIKNTGTGIYGSGIMMGVSVLAFLGSILFITGLIILIINHLSALKKLNG
jgi:hypothetical protein